MLGCGAVIYLVSRRTSVDERTPLLRLFDRTVRSPAPMELQPLPRAVGSESTTQSQQTSSPRSSPGASASPPHQWRTLPTPPRVASPTFLEVQEYTTKYLLYFYFHLFFRTLPSTQTFHIGSVQRRQQYLYGLLTGTSSLWMTSRSQHRNQMDLVLTKTSV